MIDEELKAIRKVSAALEALPQRARNRVMRYVFDSETDRELPPPAIHPASFDLVPAMQCREPDLSEFSDGGSK